MFFEVDNQVLAPLGISKFLRPALGLFDARKEIPVQRPTLVELENAKLLAHNNPAIFDACRVVRGSFIR
jgi:hypothetical protein